MSAGGRSVHRAHLSFPFGRLPRRLYFTRLLRRCGEHRKIILELSPPHIASISTASRPEKLGTSTPTIFAARERRLGTRQILESLEAQRLAPTPATFMQICAQVTLAPAWKGPNKKRIDSDESFECHFNHQLGTTFNPVLALQCQVNTLRVPQLHSIEAYTFVHPVDVIENPNLTNALPMLKMASKSFKLSTEL